MVGVLDKERQMKINIKRLISLKNNSVKVEMQDGKIVTFKHCKLVDKYLLPNGYKSIPIKTNLLEAE